MLPAAFYPDYRKHGVQDASTFVYEFFYQVKIIGQISNLSIPEHAEIVDQNEEG